MSVSIYFTGPKEYLGPRFPFLIILTDTKTRDGIVETIVSIFFTSQLKLLLIRRWKSQPFNKNNN